MNHLLERITWSDYDKDIIALLVQDNYPQYSPLTSGLEAEVVKITSNDLCFVLKVWSKESRPDVSIQFNLLDRLNRQGISVSKPYGVGVDDNKNQVLLTSFDGPSITKLDKKKLHELVRILLQVHEFPVKEIDTEIVKQYDFVDYFYSRAEEHLDIYERLIELISKANLTYNHLIHGDFHLANVVESDGKLSIIDWTNGQLGDPRFDIAWSLLIMKIYFGERKAGVYYKEFLLRSNYSDSEMELFEALACLRWILLKRRFTVPMYKNTIFVVQGILIRNRYLSEKLLT
ncbi:phosphotransferase family protein [Paenibacillus sp. GSMTC-2017]|uniref:phosphotransferase family protein n=1 Tax=Paenibacillus sp. GSMTC-2017 TaxID=2794350 RepID=UPI002FBEA4AB